MIIKYGFPTLKEKGVYKSTDSPWLNAHVFKNTPTLIFSVNSVLSVLAQEVPRWLTLECTERCSIRFNRRKRKTNIVY